MGASFLLLLRTQVLNICYNNNILEWLDNKHVVFGKLIKGQEFLDEIEKVSTHVGDVPTE